MAPVVGVALWAGHLLMWLALFELLTYALAALRHQLGGRLIPVTKGNPVMAGYINRFIDIGFPELGGLDDNGRAIVWVKIRNPRLIPGNDLLGAASKVRLDPATGQPVESDIPAATEETYKAFAKLVIAGNVWDASWIPTNFDDDTEEAPLLPMPPTAEDMGKFPMEILNAIGKELSKATPR